MWKKIFGTFHHEIAIDLGTANTLLYVKEKGIVINEPTVVAINTKTSRVVAVGNEAKDMLGKTPSYITVTRPLTKGVISDYEVVEKMLKYFLEKVQQGNRVPIRQPHVVVCIPLEVTEVEMKAVEDALLSAGAREVHLVQEPMAAAIGMHMPISDPVGNMIVDIGGGNTEIAVLSLRGVVTWRSTPFAGDEMNRNIVQYARDVFNLFIGETHAEQIKIKIGSVEQTGDVLETTVRGRDVVTGLPKEISITSDHVREALGRSLRVIIDHIKMTLESTPPELTADIHERGLLLTGGGALLKGLDTIIRKETGIPVRVSDDPLTDAVRGAGMLLDDRDLLLAVALPSSRDSKSRVS
ncbi:MAG: rod shape-determining protein [Patescibacteria group bacterium]